MAKQPTPLHDYINFKNMSGNEILINLNNVENLTQSEMMGGLLELAKRDREQKYNWNQHPITSKCIKLYVKLVQGYNAKRVIQGALMLNLLRIQHPKAWEMTSRRVLFLLHKYKARDFALMLRLFNEVKMLEFGREVDVISPEAAFQDAYKKNFKKISEGIPDNFFARVTGMLPMHVPSMTNKDLLTTLEVLVQRNLGGERLFNNYIYLKIEKNVLKFDHDQYCRTIRILADKQYVEDSVFWDEYMFKYLTHDKNGHEGKRELTFNQAKKIWDSLVYLKIRCPTIDLKDSLKNVEKWLNVESETPKEPQKELPEDNTEEAVQVKASD